MQVKYVVLSNYSCLLRSLLGDQHFIFTSNKQELIDYAKDDFGLITVITGDIIPKSIFSKFGLALNIHPASPDYPGRDPHHHAAYFRAATFGATLHIMEDKVDSGRILLTQDFSTLGYKGWRDYYHLSMISCIDIMRKIECMSFDQLLNLSSKAQWAPRKFTRSDFIKMCDCTNLNSSEMEHRHNCFSVPGFSNLYKFSNGKKVYIK